MKLVICGMVLAAFVSPALADEYWVEYNYSTHVCSVVEKKSQDTTTDTAQGTNATGGATVIAPNDTTPDATQGAGAANTTTEVGASGAPTAAPTVGLKPDVAAMNAATARAIAAYEAERKANAATTSDNTQGADAATTTIEGSGSGGPNAVTTSDAQGANAAHTTTKGHASGAPNATTTEAAPTGDTHYDPFKALAESWERKKAAAEAAGTDTTKALIGTAMHSREEAESEMQVMRKCGLRP